MTGQQICLKWNSFQANILTSFETLWEEEGLVDVTLASDGECIRAHRVILSACSPFFKRLFQSNPCQHPVIILQDVHFSELEALLSFVYKGEVNIDQENLPALLRAAETLQIRGLSGASEQLKEKMVVAKNSSSAPSRLSSHDGSPPHKRRRSDHQPPRSPATTLPTVAGEQAGQPPADSGEQLRQHKLEGGGSDSGSPVPPLPSVEEGFEESVDSSLDLKSVHVADTEQLKEITIGLESENILKVGAAFSTFKEFEDVYNAWADAGHHPMSRYKSKCNSNPLQPDHPYLYVEYYCKHHGEPRYRGRNIRPNQRYNSQGCPVKVKVTLNFRPMKYFVRQFFTDHNHEVSAELRAQYPDKRMQLDTSTEKTITRLVDDNVKPKEITTFLMESLGKTLHPKDIHNMKKRRWMKAKERILSDASHSPIKENVARPNEPDGCCMENNCLDIVNDIEVETESVPIGSASHVEDNQLEAPVIYVDTKESTSSASLVQDEHASIKVVPMNKINLPVIRVKRSDGKLNIPVSRVGKLMMVRTKPKNVILIQPPIE